MNTAYQVYFVSDSLIHLTSIGLNPIIYKTQVDHLDLLVITTRERKLLLLWLPLPENPSGQEQSASSVTHSPSTPKNPPVSQKSQSKSFIADFFHQLTETELLSLNEIVIVCSVLQASWTVWLVCLVLVSAMFCVHKRRQVHKKRRFSGWVLGKRWHTGEFVLSGQGGDNIWTGCGWHFGVPSNTLGRELFRW